MDDNIFNKLIALSNKAAKCGEVPVAAVLVCDGKIVSYAYNKRNSSGCVLDHAEILCICKYAKKIKNWHLNNCSLYVTIEPCDMCKSVIRESRIKNVYYMLKKLDFKKQFDGSSFDLIVFDDYNKKYLDIYKKIVDFFWKNRR